MSADLLRRAAKAMREKAEAADTGERWESGKVYDSLYSVYLRPSRPEDDIDGWEVPGRVNAGHEHAEHIASWHPAVALAVADWLDYEAGEIGPLVGPDGRELTYVHGSPYAFTVARAYLGEEAP